MSERHEGLDSRPEYYEDEIDLRELFARLWAGKWLIVAVSLGVGLVPAAYAWHKPPVYEVKAVIGPVTLELQSDGSPRFIESPERIAAIINAGVVKSSNKHDLAINAKVIAGTDYISLSGRVGEAERATAVAAFLDIVSGIDRFYAPRVKQVKQQQALIDEMLGEELERRHKLAARLAESDCGGQELAFLSMALAQNSANLIALHGQSAVPVPAGDGQRLATPRAIEVIQPATIAGPVDTGVARKSVLGVIAGFFLACLGVLMRGPRIKGVK